MASQVLSGTGDVTYTNNTGQNVRIVINYMRIYNTSSTVTAVALLYHLVVYRLRQELMVVLLEEVLQGLPTGQ